MYKLVKSMGRFMRIVSIVTTVELLIYIELLYIIYVCVDVESTKLA